VRHQRADRHRYFAGSSVSAYVRLPALSPLGVGHLKWSVRVARVTQAILNPRSRLAVDRRSALRLLRSGWAAESAQPFDFIEDPEAHLSDRQRELTWSINWPAAQLLDDKLAFFFMLRHLQIPTPHVPGVIIRGRVHEIGSEHAHWGPGPVRERLDKRGRLIIRPTRGGGGRDLLILESRGGEYALNGRPIDWASIENSLHELDDHLISDYVSQASYARELFPATTNTLRVITMLSPTDGPFMAGAQQRIGTPRSVPTDNTGMGGIFCDVDLRDGTLEPALEAHSPDRLIRHERHPATGARLAGVQIPNWGQVHDGLLAAAAKMPFLPYIGWDVIVTDDGFQIVEGNKCPDRPGGILRDPRARSFLIEHGVLCGR